MIQIPVIAIFDIGKTNKKLLLFDEQYNLVFEETTKLDEICDEDSFPCEDVMALCNWVKSSFESIIQNEAYDVKAVNFSAYGASFVYVDKDGKVLTPLYNYLKPYPQQLKQEFYNRYGGEKKLARETASPVLDSLNSGMQIYRLKKEKPGLFAKIAFAFHLPQYISYLLANFPATDITSIGCHTSLWNFEENKYHRWVSEEEIESCFAPIVPSDTAVSISNNGKRYECGIGLHDSSAALIPYLISFKEPFVLISTGTWCISLNPFNSSPLTDEELQQDCLCYLTYEGNPVKASRLFAGYEHEQQVKRLSAHFNQLPDHYASINFNPALIKSLQQKNAAEQLEADHSTPIQSVFGKRDLADFDSYETAYHQLMIDIVSLQVISTALVLKNSSVKKIFVDGGFSKNPIFMHLLALSFSTKEIYAASVPQATALGAALVLHQRWNSHSLPTHLVQLNSIAL